MAGNAYVGAKVPAGIKTAFNFTIDSARRDLLFVNIDRDNSPRTTSRLPDPTFLVVNVRDGDLSLAHSAVGLGHDSVYLFTGIEGFWYPRTRSSMATGGAHLVPTGTEGTYQVRWIVDAEDVKSLKARPVTLGTRGATS
jgi:hypothetical protein